MKDHKLSDQTDNQNLTEQCGQHSEDKPKPAIAGIKILLFTIFTIHKEEMFESAKPNFN